MINKHGKVSNKSPLNLYRNEFSKENRNFQDSHFKSLIGNKSTNFVSVKIIKLTLLSTQNAKAFGNILHEKNFHKRIY